MTDNNMQTTLEMVRMTLEMVRMTKEGIEFTAHISRFIGSSALHILKAILNAINHVRTTGQQSYKTLNRTASRTGMPLGKPVEVPDEYAKRMIKTLKHYGVDFAVFESPKGGQQIVVKAANMETLNVALEKTIAEATQPHQSRFAEILKAAKAKAEHFNAARMAEARNIPHPSRSAPVR